MKRCFIIIPLLAAIVAGIPTVLPMKVIVQSGQSAEFPPHYKGVDTLCTSMTPTVVSAPQNGNITMLTRRSFNWFPNLKYAGQVRLWSKVPVTWFKYTPNSGFIGKDSFTYNVNYGSGTTNTEKVVIRVHPGEPGGMKVLLVVNDQILSSVNSEVNRLKTDLQNEGYVAEIKTFPNSSMATSAGISDTNAVKALWDTLRNEYDKPNQMMAGAILIGKIPVAAGGVFLKGAGNKWDDQYWNMADWLGTFISNGMHLIARDSVAVGYRPTEPDTFSYCTYGYSRGLIGAGQRHIWVTRMWGLDNYGRASTYGSENVLLKRILDANHNYRTGKSRLPHTAWAYDKETTRAPLYDPTKLNSIWPKVVNLNVTKGPANKIPLMYLDGGDYYDQNSHGGDNYFYMLGNSALSVKLISDSLMNHPFQCRFMTASACHSANPGSITNQHTFTRGGGCVFITSGSEYVQNNGYFGLAWSQLPCKETMRGQIASGARWCRAWLNSGMPVASQLFYGDGSLKPMMHPSNELPVIASVTATSLGSGNMQIRVNANDPDGAISLYEYWINRKYNKGRNEPDSAGSALSQFTAKFDSITTVRLEAVDNYMARSIIEFTVVPDSGIRSVEGLATAIESEQDVPKTEDVSVYPNPCNPSTVISYNVKHDKALVKISIKNISGKTIALLSDKAERKGVHRMNWTGFNNVDSKCSSGLYFVSISINGKLQTRPLLLVK